jgi:hypothetical protein
MERDHWRNHLLMGGGMTSFLQTCFPDIFMKFCASGQGVRKFIRSTAGQCEKQAHVFPTPA